MKHLLVLIFIFLALPIVFSQEEITQNQLIVEIYVAESGRALVTGYVSEDALNSLPFLEGSNYVFYNDTSEIYAVTDALTSKEGGTWTLNSSANFIEVINKNSPRSCPCLSFVIPNWPIFIPGY